MTGLLSCRTHLCRGLGPLDLGELLPLLRLPISLLDICVREAFAPQKFPPLGLRLLAHAELFAGRLDEPDGEVDQLLPGHRSLVRRRRRLCRPHRRRLGRLVCHAFSVPLMLAWTDEGVRLRVDSREPGVEVAGGPERLALDKPIHLFPHSSALPLFVLRPVPSVCYEVPDAQQARRALPGLSSYPTLSRSASQFRVRPVALRLISTSMDDVTRPLPSMPPDIILLFVGAVADSVPREGDYHPGLYHFPSIPESDKWRGTLLPLCKVSKTWHRAVRPLLVRHIGFKLRDWRRYLSKIFGYVVHVAPHSCGLVRSLDLCLLWGTMKDVEDTALVDRHTAELIALLGRLDSVWFQGDLDKFPRVAAELSSPKRRIRHLDISSGRHPAMIASIQSSAASLKSLRVSLCNNGQLSSSDWRCIVRLPHLEFLALQSLDTRGLFELGTSTALASSLRMPRLRHLHLEGEHTTSGSLLLVRANETTLESLSVHHGNIGLSFPPEDDDQGQPQCFPRLQRLHYCPLEYEDEVEALHAIRGLSLPRLETLSIVSGVRLYIHLPAFVAELRSLKTLICGFLDQTAGTALATDDEALIVHLQQWAPSVSVIFPPDGY